VALTGFWWFTIWFLLAGRISWRDLFPAAVATAVFWVAMEAVFSVIFSSTVIRTTEVRADRRGLCPDVLADRHRGGDHPGRGGGIVWRERNLSFRAALKKLRRDRGAPQGPGRS
jgi:hypothetical protein